ncbi:MAG: glycosyltransferase [Flavobacteriaceae bacterium]
MRLVRFAERQVLASLVSLSVLLRFPFFFRDYIDKDESTFILMGQAWVDGFLPYTLLWDLKPPLVFLYFAKIIYLFGKSLLAIRFFGAVIVGFNGYLLYRIARNHTSSIYALTLGVLTIYFQSLFGSVQGVMSEHLGLFPILLGCYLLVENRNYFWGALLFSLGLYFKLNIAYGMLLAFPFLFFQRRDEMKQMIAGSILGGVLATLITGIWFIGNTSLFLESVFYAPLAYTKATISQQLKTFLSLLPAFILLAWLFKRYPKHRFYTLFTAGVLFSLIRLGKVNGHYLLQVYPFMILVIGILIYELKRKLSPQIVLILLVIIPIETYKETWDLMQYHENTGYWYNGEGHEIARFLKDHDLDKKTAYYTDYHIGYWLTNNRPLTKVVTHPSNIERPELFPFMRVKDSTPVAVLKELLINQKPEIIVAKSRKNFKDAVLESMLASALKQNYQQIKSVGSTFIYKRK